MASLVPEPMEKWAVWAASPSRTTLPWCQVRLLTVVKPIQRERLPTSGWPSSSAANSSSHQRMLAASSAWSSPARRQDAWSHSTMKVLMRAS